MSWAHFFFAVDVTKLANLSWISCSAIRMCRIKTRTKKKSITSRFCCTSVHFNIFCFFFPLEFSCYWNVCVLSWLNQNSIFMNVNAWQMIELPFRFVKDCSIELTNEISDALVRFWNARKAWSEHTSTEACNNKNISKKKEPCIQQKMEFSLNCMLGSQPFFWLIVAKIQCVCCSFFSGDVYRHTLLFGCGFSDREKTLYLFTLIFLFVCQHNCEIENDHK